MYICKPYYGPLKKVGFLDPGNPKPLNAVGLGLMTSLEATWVCDQS